MQYSAYVFDAYGTLFDVHSAVARLAGRIGPEAAAFSELWRGKQLEYAWVRTLMGAYRDFWQLTADALDFALARFPSVNRGLRPELLDAYSTLDAFPEVAAVLDGLKQGGARLAILSNGSPDMLATAVSSAGLDGSFDRIIFGGRNRYLQDAPRCLPPGDRRVEHAAGRHLLPVVQPLGYCRRGPVRVPHGVGEPHRAT